MCVVCDGVIALACLCQGIHLSWAVSLSVASHSGVNAMHDFVNKSRKLTYFTFSSDKTILAERENFPTK
jgi:hypothetical protein